MKKIIRLTESDLTRIVKRVLLEQSIPGESGSVPSNFAGGSGNINVSGKGSTNKTITDNPYSCVSPSDYKFKGKTRSYFRYVTTLGSVQQPVDYHFYDNGEVWVWTFDRNPNSVNVPNKNKLFKKGKWSCGKNELIITWEDGRRETQPLPKNYQPKMSGLDKCAQNTMSEINSNSGKYLFRGCKTKAVGELQQALGFTSDKIDNDFGPYTEKIVKEFQKENGLSVDGRVGRETLALIVAKRNTSKREGPNSYTNKGQAVAVDRKQRIPS